MVFAAYLLENTILVLSRGGTFAPYFQAPPWGFCMKALPHRGAFAAFPKQNDKCPTNAQGGWARLELTEPLLNQILGILFAGQWQVFIGGRVCDVRTDLGSLVSLKFLFGFGNQRFSFSLVCSFLPITTM